MGVKLLIGEFGCLRLTSRERTLVGELGVQMPQMYFDDLVIVPSAPDLTAVFAMPPRRQGCRTTPLRHWHALDDLSVTLPPRLKVDLGD